MFQKIKRYCYRHGGLYGALKNMKEIISKFGIRKFFKRLFSKSESIQALNYQLWIENVEQKYNESYVQEKLNSMVLTPKISVLIPVYNVEEVYLRACIDSVRNQYYANWEICIADDNSSAPHIKMILEEYIEEDSRIRVVFRKQNGHISEATNSALEIATGEYIALLDNDDTLKKEALMEMVLMINEHPDADMLYSDEDKVDSDGIQRLWPAFKPDWSPDAFLSQMYLCHLGVYRRLIAIEVGGFSTPYNGAQDYDFALKFSEKTSAIYHVPKILYHWRMIPTSTSMGVESKSYAFDASFAAKSEVIKRRNYDAELIPFDYKNSTIVEFNIHEKQKISLLLLDVNGKDNLVNLLESILLEMKHSNYEILIGSGNDYINSAVQQNKFVDMPIEIINIEKTLPHGKQYNILAEKSSGEVLVFLATDLVISSECAIERIAGHALQSYTGVASGLIVDTKDYIEEAGIIWIQKGHKFRRAFNRFHISDKMNFDRLQFTFNYLAFTSRVMAIEKEKFFAMNMFSENEIFYDIDLCMKLYSKGYFNVYRGDADFTHKDSKNIDAIFGETQSTKLMREKWLPIIGESDPFYNINLSQEKGDYTIRTK